MKRHIRRTVRAKQTQSGAILNSVDKDSYYVDLEVGQTLSVALNTTNFTAPNNPNLDSQLVLKKTSGSVVLTSNPTAAIPAMNASIEVSH